MILNPHIKILRHKVCTRCGIDKPVWAFYRQKWCKFGVRPDCKECMKKRASDYLEANRDECNRKLREYTKTERSKESTARYKEKNRESIAEKRRKYLDKNWDRISQVRRKNREKNCFVNAEYDRQYRIDNREAIKERMDRWHKSEIGVAAGRRAAGKRRAKLAKAVQGDPAQIKKIYARAASSIPGPCFYCGEQIAAGDCHVDHIVPLFSGGSHTPENLCLSCSGCNLSKQVKPALFFGVH